MSNGNSAPVNKNHSETPNLFTSEDSGQKTTPTNKVAVNGIAKSMNNSQSDQQDSNSTPTNLETFVNYQRAIDNLEYTLIQLNRHQRQILQVHEQSLRHQTEYTNSFFGLMQQQHILWGNGQFIEKQPETQQLAISSLERSMMRFHDHQADSLRIHEQYLKYQQEYTHNFFQLVQQHQLPTCDDRIQHSLNTPVYGEERPIPVTAVSAVATELQTVTTNGSGNGNGQGAHHQTIPVTDIIATRQNPTATIVATPPVDIDPATLQPTLLTIVSDQTGYPSEMLEMSMDIEADLGIDSIKRVEILGALLEIYPDLPRPNLEELAQLRTLAEIAEYIRTIATPTINKN